MKQNLGRPGKVTNIWYIKMFIRNSVRLYVYLLIAFDISILR